MLRGHWHIYLNVLKSPKPSIFLIDDITPSHPVPVHVPNFQVLPLPLPLISHCIPHLTIGDNIRFDKTPNHLTLRTKFFSYPYFRTGILPEYLIISIATQSPLPP